MERDDRRTSILGIVGEGHLARLLAAAARELDITPRLLPVRDVAALTADPSGAGRRARELVGGCDVVTVATERCPAAALRQLARHVPVHPSPDAVAVAQDRWIERTWLEERGIQTPACRRVTAPDAVPQALQALGGQAFLKPCVRGDDDGRPVFVRRPEHAMQAWEAFGAVPLLVEEAASIDLELAVLVARGQSGELVTYPPVLSQRQATRLSWTLMPAPIPAEIADRARGWARDVAEGLRLVGVGTIEVYWLTDGRLVLNEMVVGPHHALVGDDAAYRAGQCAQQVRAVTGLPLAPATPLRPTASAPISGDLWTGGRVPDFDQVRALPGVRVSFYGDREPARGRALGHVSASADSGEAAVSLLLAAQRRLIAGSERPRVSRTGDPVPTT